MIFEKDPWLYPKIILTIALYSYGNNVVTTGYYIKVSYVYNSITESSAPQQLLQWSINYHPTIRVSFFGLYVFRDRWAQLL